MNTDTHLISLLGMLSHPDTEVREHAERVLANIGAPAVPRLLHLCRQNNTPAAVSAGKVLAAMGGEDLLPAKVLADRRLSPARRLRTLQALRHIYALPPLKALCEEAAGHPDPAVRQGAEEVLNELSRRSLLRASERDPTAEEAQLLRMASSGAVSNPETLLRAGSVSEIVPPKQTSFWAACARRLWRQRS